MSTAAARLRLPVTLPCDICGADMPVEEWLDVTSFGDRNPQYTPGRTVCPTPRCGEVCKICRGEIGDVHGPHCGELMFNKIEKPHIIDRSDCT